MNKNTFEISIDKNNFDNENYHYEKRILQFFSGGADSTYLLLQNLRCNRKVTATYVNIVNNQAKPEREEIARKLLKEDIDVFCNYFHCPKPVYLEDHSIEVHYALSRCGAPQQIIFGMFALLMGRDFDEIHLGVVLGDSMRGVRFYDDLVEAYRSKFRNKMPEIKYPIEDVSKESIYLTLKGYDKLLGTNFIKHITVCESVDKPCGKIKICSPCKTQQEVFKRLKWVK